jgi:hypothetical protein
VVEESSSLGPLGGHSADVALLLQSVSGHSFGRRECIVLCLGVGMSTHCCSGMVHHCTPVDDRYLSACSAAEHAVTLV